MLDRFIENRRSKNWLAFIIHFLFNPSLDSLETGTGLMRAVNAMVEHKVHLANMSYGEPSAYPDFGRFIEHLRDTCVLKKQVIFVSSAGNEGPTISSVGTPGGTTSSMNFIWCIILNFKRCA